MSRERLNLVLAVALCAFTLVEVNYPILSPQSQLATFALIGTVLCFLNRPAHPSVADKRAWRAFDATLAVLAVAVYGFIIVQTEPFTRALWSGGQSLGNRAGQETTLDTAVGVLGLVLVLEATRRTLGWALPVLAGVFLLYATFGASLPDFLFPHRGYGVERIVAQTFLHSQGVFGTALRVMFVYVFLFVLFGAILQQTGATQFIIDLARRLLGRSPGGPAKVAVVSSGLMGSLSGSAVANTATTGTFTIPLMRSAGFKPEVAAGVEAAASSGGALVPPVMGAGAYMMLEIIDPPVTYLQIVQAAILPALLYYLSLTIIVHLHAHRIGVGRQDGVAPEAPPDALLKYEGVVFVVGMATLIAMLIAGFTVFRAATVALVAVVAVSSLQRGTRLTWRKSVDALSSTARDAVPLIVAAASVGIVIGVVTLTGVGSKLPSAILALAQGNLVAALVLIMIATIILGMGLPSAVCYLLMATLIGPVLGQLGVVPLAAHLFIFYFGMMSMVTPPVALAAYAAGSIAGAGIMQTGLVAFRIALVGFALPYVFVFRPELLQLAPDGGPASAGAVIVAAVAAVAGIVPLAGAIAGWLLGPLGMAARTALAVSAALLLWPARGPIAGAGALVPTAVGLTLLAAVAVASLLRRGAANTRI